MRTGKLLLVLIISSLVLHSCSKDYTNFYPDGEDPGLAIFSNRSNNLMTCFADGNPWRTDSRISYLLSRQKYEVYIQKQLTNSLFDTLSIEWTGYYSNDRTSTGYISLILPVAKNFAISDLSAFEGQRFNFDGTKGFFTVTLPGLNSTGLKGTGNIYFHSARLYSIGPGLYGGNLSGLFEADFNSFKLSKGRFDHDITPYQLIF